MCCVVVGQDLAKSFGHKPTPDAWICCKKKKRKLYLFIITLFICMLKTRHLLLCIEFSVVTVRWPRFLGEGGPVLSQKKALKFE